MSARSIRNITRKVVLFGTLLFTLSNIGTAQAAFPYDLESGVTFTEPLESRNIRSFAETSVLTASINPGANLVTMVHDRRSTWQGGTGFLGTVPLSCCNANVWAFRLVGGEWFGATWDYMRVGGTTRPFDAIRGGGHQRGAPLASLGVPRTGEVVGLMMAGITRLGLSNNVFERTNIVFIRVGGGVVDPVELGFPPEDGILSEASNLAPIINTLLND